MSDAIKALYESEELVKVYVPDFSTFQADPDKWLSQLPGYGDETFGDETDPQAQTDEFEAGAGDVQMQGQTDTGSQSEVGDSFGDTGATGGETGDDTGAGFGDAQTQTQTDEFSQTQPDGQTQTDEFSQTQTETPQGQNDEFSQTEETNDDEFSTEESEPISDDEEKKEDI
jgi:hypothetical protein